MCIRDRVYAERTAIIIGNESKGLSAEVSQLADMLVRIPMEGRAESLNAAVAAAILMYQSRIRRSSSDTKVTAFGKPYTERR